MLSSLIVLISILWFLGEHSATCVEGVGSVLGVWEDMEFYLGQSLLVTSIWRVILKLWLHFWNLIWSKKGVLLNGYLLAWLILSSRILDERASLVSWPSLLGVSDLRLRSSVPSKTLIVEQAVGTSRRIFVFTCIKPWVFLLVLRWESLNVDLPVVPTLERVLLGAIDLVHPTSTHWTLLLSVNVLERKSVTRVWSLIILLILICDVSWGTKSKLLFCRVS